MRLASIGVALILVAVGCGSTSTSARLSPAPAATTPPVAAVTPAAVTPSAPAPSPTDVGPSCAPVQRAPAFGASAPSDRNLAIARLQGSADYVVRDVTDIGHATTVASLPVHGYQHLVYRLVGPADVSYVVGDACGYLVRHNFVSGTATYVALGSPMYDWSANGTKLVFVGSDGQKTVLTQIAGGAQTVLAQVPPLPVTGCETQECVDSWQFAVGYSPDGRSIFVMESTGKASLGIFTDTGATVYSPDSSLAATMAVWSGEDLYFRDSLGVQVWHAGAVSTVLKDVRWIDPKASPGGGSIVFTVRDPSGLPRIRLLDTATATARDIATSADSPHFLTARYVWYRAMRSCVPSDGCQISPVTATGKTYIVDLQTGAAFESKIADVQDTWPHGA